MKTKHSCLEHLRRFRSNLCRAGTSLAGPSMMLVIGVLFLGLQPAAAQRPSPPDPELFKCEKDYAKDDVSGQKDLTQTCLARGAGNISLWTKWNWDEIELNGSNTGDACSLFDSDHDGNVNFAMCVTWDQATSYKAVRLLACGGDVRPDNCDDPVLLNRCSNSSKTPCSYNSDCPGDGKCEMHTLTGISLGRPPDTFCEVNQSSDDPWGTAADTQAICALYLSDLNPTEHRFLDTCSYPSASTPSSASDCILAKACAADADCPNSDFCSIGACDTSLHICRYSAAHQGEKCDDQDACTLESTCSDGFCLGTGARSCDDGNPCTVDSCNSSTGCQHAAGNKDALCRTAAGACDIAEYCDGSSTTCPEDAKSTAECRSSAGACDVAERCDGILNDCPADTYAPSTTVCRGSAGICDVEEKCTGLGAECPADTFALSTRVCRGSTGICDVEERCTGSSPSCPADTFAPSTTVCRFATGICDVAEKCTGSSASCPAEVFVASGTVCRGSTGPCDLAATCTGTNGVCPANGFVAAGTPCRAKNGDCDVADTCTGASAACPDLVESSAKECRSSAGICDVAEKCTGSTKTCPNDGFKPKGTTCRPAAALCDAEEQCTGSGASCPDDLMKQVGTVCRPMRADCDYAEYCDGNLECPTDTWWCEELDEPRLAPTSNTCEDYSSGFLWNLEPTGYQVKGGKISQTNPGEFFFYDKVHVPDSENGTAITVTQTASFPTLLLGVIKEENQILLYDEFCNRTKYAATFDQYGTATFTGIPVGTYIVRVKYQTKSLVGKDAPMQLNKTYPPLSYTFASHVGNLSSTWVTEELGVIFVPKK